MATQSSAHALSPTPALTASAVVEAEDFTPQGANGWRVVKNGEGNYMVDTIGFNHISGERVLSAPANAKDAVARSRLKIPAAGTYRVWSRFEQPTQTENRFRVTIRQNGKIVGEAVMGERLAPKYFFADKNAVPQHDAPWGSEGLVEQSFDVPNLQAGDAEIVLTAVDQNDLSATRANRNVDFIFLTQDLEDKWRDSKTNRLYPILDAALAAMPPRYYLRLLSPAAQTIDVSEIRNRLAWNASEGSIKLEANTFSEWLPLLQQDVAHFTTLALRGPAKQRLKLRVELATAPEASCLLRSIAWDDPHSNELLISLPPYPQKNAGEKIQTVEEQYLAVVDYLAKHPSKEGREPKAPLAWGGYIPVWQRGAMADAAARLYRDIGMRGFLGLVQPSANAASIAPAIAMAGERFKSWNAVPGRTVALGKYRFLPNEKNIAESKKFAEESGLMPYIHRYDYGDEIAFSEWLIAFSPEELKAHFAVWQQKHNGKAQWETSDSSAAAAERDPELYVDSLRFYEESSIEHVATQAKAIRPALGKDVLFGANVAAHPFYYPEIAKYVKWFRQTASGDYAANFGRHSEYFWQTGQPGPLINSYIADHFRAGMRDNPEAQLLQYTMPHSPGNTDASFRRTAFSHLAHGAKGLDYFGIGLNHSFSENYIDFRDHKRFAAIRDINRSMATIEDILPTSTVAPSRIALILSESTERWDMAGIAQDRAGVNVFGEGYKKLRLAYHLDRVGIYYALVHASRPPDLLIEEDVQHGLLKDYDVAYWVGDCAEPKTVAALQGWMNNGGHLVATAGALRYDDYKRPAESGNELLGLASAKLDAQEWFFRPQIELPRMKPIGTLACGTPASGMPAIAVRDHVRAAPDAKVVGAYEDTDEPGVIQMRHGKGRSTYIAALPGVAYLWSAYQNAGGQHFVPSRGPSSHADLTGFDTPAQLLITRWVTDVKPQVEAPGAWIDARLLQSTKGKAIVLSNYSVDVGRSVTLLLRNVGNVTSISSARAGKLKWSTDRDGAIRLKYSPGYGDILRIE